MPNGPLLRRLRKDQGLTQVELGKLIGVRQATISELERNKYSRTHVEILQKLARFFGVTVDELLIDEVAEEELMATPHL